MKHFLKFASHLTDTPIEQIKVINYFIDENGFYIGIIEINGNREYIHEYSC
jgi:hypothetical protein